MELRQLQYLDKVIAAGGFRSAARELGVTQPTLTAQVRQLELDFGVVLVDRTRRPIRTTPAGEVVLVRVRELLATMAKLRAEIADIAEQQTGRLRLGTNEWAVPILPSLMAAFTTRYPNVEVLQQRVGREGPRLLARGELDVCLLALRGDQERLPKQLQSTRLFSFEQVFAVQPGHRLAGRPRVNLDDLADERLVLANGNSGTMLKEALSSVGIAPHVAYETDDLDMLTSLVAQGVGIGFIPDFVVRRSQPNLKTFSIVEVSFKSDALVTWAVRLRDAPALRSFVGFVTSQRWGVG